MVEAAIPEDVRQFLTESIDSVVQLELLMLLRRRPADAWTVADVARELRIELVWAASDLEKLAAHGLITVHGEPSAAVYRYGSRTADLDEVISRTIDTYEKRRVSVIGAIYSRPADAIRTFADAFRVRKD